MTHSELPPRSRLSFLVFTFVAKLLESQCVRQNCSKNQSKTLFQGAFSASMNSACLHSKLAKHGNGYSRVHTIGIQHACTYGSEFRVALFDGCGSTLQAPCLTGPPPPPAGVDKWTERRPGAGGRAGTLAGRQAGGSVDGQFRGVLPEV